MPLGSYRSSALASLQPADVESMLKLNETLFIEHKSGVRDKGNQRSYKLAEATAAFANTFGGWLLLNVANGKIVNTEPDWGAVALVDAVRDRLRGQVDPLPPFEARIINLPDGPVGVVRVYESADTPHILMSSGAVVVREPAGVRDAAKRRSPGVTASDEARYRIEAIASRTQLLELARRGERARERVDALLDPLAITPLVTATGLRFEVAAGGVLQPHPSVRPGVYMRMIPFTPTERFSAWATTHEAQAATIGALEQLTGLRGLGNDWAGPHPAGVSTDGPVNSDKTVVNATGSPIQAHAHVAIDQVGVVTTALTYDALDAQQRGWTSMQQIEDRMVAPLLATTADLLQRAEFMGRAACHFVLNRLGDVLLLQGSGERGPAGYVPVGGVVDLPTDQTQLAAMNRRSVNALARSAGLPAWDRSDAPVTS